MKEKYNLKKAADAFVHDARVNYKELDSEYHSSGSGSTALLVLDMQNVFLQEASHAFIPTAPDLTPKILQLIELFQKTDNSVLLTRHVNNQDNAGMMKHWWRDLIVEDDLHSQIIPELKALNLPTITKSQYDAFYLTELDEWLRESDVTQVVITGVMTHLCCETTARSAFTRGYRVLFPIDGTATYNSDFHRATLLNLSHGFAEIITVDYVEKYLHKA